MNEPKIHWHESIDPTMYEAARLAASGCEHLTAVVADEQTAGHGRHGRAWHSEKGAGLYATVVLRVDMQPADIPLVTLALGLAVAEAIHNVTGLNCDLRWPNDILIHGRKCCGILAQLHGSSRSRSRARWIRDFTVASGTSSVRAMSGYASPSMS